MSRQQSPPRWALGEAITAEVITVAVTTAAAVVSRVESKPATEGRIKTSQSEAGLFISFLLFHARCLATS